ncbi:hypothetical protein BT93_E1413 [Corymbia citriodora subsp. variegata]|nr:hypothetical protein BT93_E1413 [Corymbia citriodora subsp. variegata]
MHLYKSFHLRIIVLVVHALSATSYVESTVGPNEFETLCDTIGREVRKRDLAEGFLQRMATPRSIAAWSLQRWERQCHESSSLQYWKSLKAILGRSQITWSQCRSTVRSSSSPHNTSSTLVWNWCAAYVARSLPSVKACEGKINDSCCAKLVKMGPECHDRWVKINLAKPEFARSSNAILDRSTKLWKKCVSYV